MSSFPGSPPTISAAPVAVPTAQPSLNQPGREQLAKAARQFEAIFVREMLAQARKSNFGGEALLGGQAMDTFRQMQDERFADLAAERGAFGLGKMIEAQLARQIPVESPSRLREGLGEGLLSDLAQHALPRPLPQAGGEANAPGLSGGSS